MFNTTYAKAYTNINVNAVGGTLIKSHPMSKFKTIHTDSGSARFIFSSGSPRLEQYGKEIVVLQIMLTGGKSQDVMIEYVMLTDYLEED